MAWPTPKIVYRPLLITVDATNNKINFKETAGGGELTATLTSGRYSPQGLAAEVKRALDAAGASTYTVRFNVSGANQNKFTLTSNGSGGGGAFQLLWGTGTNAATDANGILGFNATDKTGALTYTSDSVAPAAVTLTFHEDVRGPVASLEPDGNDATASVGRKQVLTRRVDAFYRFTMQWVPRTSMESWWDFFEQCAAQGGQFDFYPDSGESTFVNFTAAERKIIPNPEKPFQYFDFTVRLREVLPEENVNTPGGRGSRLKTLINRSQWL